MAELYATLIIGGKRTFESIPATQKTKVREILIASGNEELVA